MRYVVPALLTLILGSTALHAQGSWAEKLFKDGKTTHDFGSVPRGTQLFHRFKLYNIYAVPLEITTRFGCNCVTVTPSTRVLQPKQEGYIDVYMDARRFTGPKTVTIHFTVGPEYVSTAAIQVSANSRADVVLNPGQISFGVIQQGQKPQPQTLDVEYAGVLDWRVTEIAGHSYPVEATFKEQYRRPGQVGYRVTVSLKADAPSGALKCELFLKTNDPASPLVPVLVEATVQASLSVVPSNLNLGNLKLGESITKKVIVRGNKPFRVLAVDGAGEGVATEPLPTVAAPTQIVLIKCQPDKVGNLKRQLKLKTDLDKESVVTVTVEGVVEP
jgi:hypothetical protein